MAKTDHFYAEMLNMMREQGRKDNPVILQLGIMQSEDSVKVDELVLTSEDLYIADYLVGGYSRAVSGSQVTFIDGLKKGDLVAVQGLHNTNKYVILAKVVSV